MKSLSYNRLVERLIEDDKNVLFLDTCCLLDIVRCLTRGNMPVFESALNISNAIEGDDLSFSIVLPSLVPEEWKDNIDTVVLEAERFIEEQFRALKNIKEVLAKLNSDVVLNFGAFDKIQIEQKLRAISQRIMNSSYVCEKDNSVDALVLSRVIDTRPPARKGKDSTKDCIIYEEVLHVSSRLKESGFRKRIIFASSNTKEYCDENISLHPIIKEELNERGIKFVSSLNWAESEAKKCDLQDMGSVDKDSM